MTRQRFRDLAKTPIPGWLLFLGALLPVAAGLAGAARFVKLSADATYVRRDSFALIQQGQALKQQQQDELAHQLLVKLDSANLRLTQIQCGKKIDVGCR